MSSIAIVVHGDVENIQYLSPNGGSAQLLDTCYTQDEINLF